MPVCLLVLHYYIWWPQCRHLQYLFIFFHDINVFFAKNIFFVSNSKLLFWYHLSSSQLWLHNVLHFYYCITACPRRLRRSLLSQLLVFMLNCSDCNWTTLYGVTSTRPICSIGTYGISLTLSWWWTETSACWTIDTFDGIPCLSRILSMSMLQRPVTAPVSKLLLTPHALHGVSFGIFSFKYVFRFNVFVFSCSVFLILWEQHDRQCKPSTIHVSVWKTVFHDESCVRWAPCTQMGDPLTRKCDMICYKSFQKTIKRQWEALGSFTV